MYFYLGLWFPQAYRGRAIAVLMVGGVLSNIIAGPLSALLLSMDNLAGLHGWQWLFLIEGLPAFVLSFVVLRFLPDGPADAPWLSDLERNVVASRLATDPPAEHRKFWPALRDPRVYALGLVWFGIVLSVYGFDLWLPQIVQGMGFSHLEIGFVVALIFAAGAVSQVLVAQSSDALGERIWHVALPTFVGAAGWIASAGLVESVVLTLLALTIVRVGINATYGPFWNLPTLFLGGPAAAGGIGLIAAMGSFGGFVGSFAMGFLKQTTGSYTAGMAFLAFGMLASAIIVLAYGRVITRCSEQLRAATSI